VQDVDIALSDKYYDWYLLLEHQSHIDKNPVLQYTTDYLAEWFQTSKRSINRFLEALKGLGNTSACSVNTKRGRGGYIQLDYSYLDTPTATIPEPTPTDTPEVVEDVRIETTTTTTTQKPRLRGEIKREANEAFQKDGYTISTFNHLENPRKALSVTNLSMMYDSLLLVFERQDADNKNIITKTVEDYHSMSRKAPFYSANYENFEQVYDFCEERGIRPSYYVSVIFYKYFFEAAGRKTLMEHPLPQDLLSVDNLKRYKDQYDYEVAKLPDTVIKIQEHLYTKMGYHPAVKPYTSIERCLASKPDKPLEEVFGGAGTRALAELTGYFKYGDAPTFALPYSDTERYPMYEQLTRSQTYFMHQILDWKDNVDHPEFTHRQLEMFFNSVVTLIGVHFRGVDSIGSLSLGDPNVLPYVKDWASQVQALDFDMLDQDGLTKMSWFIQGTQSVSSCEWKIIKDGYDELQGRFISCYAMNKMEQGVNLTAKLYNMQYLDHETYLKILATLPEKIKSCFKPSGDFLPMVCLDKYEEESRGTRDESDETFMASL